MVSKYKYRLREIPFIFQESSVANARGVYVLIHGLSTSKDEYLDFYVKLSGMLNKEGFSILRFDFPGHGDSEECGVHFNLRTCFYEAAIMARFAVDELSPGKALNLFGTSFGAGPALFAASALSEKVERVTLLAPAVQYRELYIDPISEERRRRYEGFLETSVFYDSQLQINERISLGWENAVEFATMNLDWQLSEMEGRLSVIHGDEDEAIPVSLVRKLMEGLPNSRFIVREGMEHGFTQLGDEVGMDVRSQANLDAIVAEAVRAA